MSSGSKIEWTEATWNPVTGCTKISAGCKHCYAERITHRFRGKIKYAGLTDGKARFNGNVKLHLDAISLPMKWRRPRMIFVCSMSDLFHESVPFEFTDKVFSAMAKAPQHTFQILTKRPDRMKDFLSSSSCLGRREYLSNLWLGTSIENQRAADERIPDLLACPAAVRFVSCEPLLGPINFVPSSLRPSVPSLDWVIVGGESGPNARPMRVDWARSIRDQCARAGVAFFFKQWGEWCRQDAFPPRNDASPRVRRVQMGDGTYWRIGKKQAGRLLDGVEHNGMPGSTLSVRPFVLSSRMKR